MRALFATIIANALALLAAAWLIPGITLQGGSTSQVLITAVLVALLFGVVNALIKPVVTFFSFPLIILTLGLFAIVVNAAMLMLTSWLSTQLGLSFHVDGFFWSGVLGAVVVSVVTMIVHAVVPDREPRRHRELSNQY